MLILLCVCVVFSIGVFVSLSYLPLSAASIGLFYFLLKRRAGGKFPDEY